MSETTEQVVMIAGASRGELRARKTGLAERGGAPARADERARAA